MQAYPYDAVTPHLIPAPPPPPPPPGTMVPLAAQMQLLPQPILLPPGTPMYSQPQGFGQVFAQPVTYHQSPAALQHQNVTHPVQPHRQIPITQDPTQPPGSLQDSSQPTQENVEKQLQSGGTGQSKQSPNNSLEKSGQKGAQAILQASQLSLPPPPPPPPPIPGVTPEAPLSPALTPTTENNRFQNQKRPYQGSSQPWSFNHQKQAPAGNQGPWKNQQEGQTEGGSRSSPLKRPADDSSPEKAASSNSSNQRLTTHKPGFTNAPGVYRDTYVDPKEPGLPKELTVQFEPLYCKLCTASLSSTVQAKLHYTGKPHQKKVRAYLLNWSQKTGQPVPKRPKNENAKEPVNPEDLYCSVCDVTFSSLKHGEQHKMGKAHQKALKRGYTSKKPKKVEVPYDPSGRFGIGSSFLPQSQNTSEEKSNSDLSNPPKSNIPTWKQPVPAPPTHKFYCDLCNISTTSQSHLDTHMGGMKHRKALAASAKAGVPVGQQSNIPPPSVPADSILASLIKPKDGGAPKRGSTSDLSIYRTPSGHFYCSPCNLTVNSEKVFMEHTESKKHKFKASSQKKPAPGHTASH